ncbi:DUF3099 domain-containing protein, partial [Mycobacterium tuberculosis]
PALEPRRQPAERSAPRGFADHG